jgi:hypothetical protein
MQFDTDLCQADLVGRSVFWFSAELTVSCIPPPGSIHSWLISIVPTYLDFRHLVKDSGELIGIVESHISHSIPEEKLYASQVKIVNKSGRVFDKSSLYNLARRDDMRRRDERERPCENPAEACVCSKWGMVAGTVPGLRAAACRASRRPAGREGYSPSPWV